MTIPHTAECRARQAADQANITRLKAERAALQTQYPNVCLQCEGRGCLDDSDPDVGISNWMPCSCIEAEMCPRCGRAGLSVNLEADDPENILIAPCAGCGWAGIGTWELPPLDGYDPDLCICGAEERALAALRNDLIPDIDLDAMFAAELRRYERGR